MTNATTTDISPDALQVLHQELEHNLHYAGVPKTALSHKIAYLLLAMHKILDWNEQMGGTPDTWDKEPDREYVSARGHQILRLLQTMRVEFAQNILGLSEITDPTLPNILQTTEVSQMVLAPTSPINPDTAQTEPAADPAKAKKTEEPKLRPVPVVNRKEAEKIALSPVTGIKGRNGKPLRGGGTVAGNQRAIQFVNILHRSGGLTADQLRFLTDFTRPLGPAAGHEVQETLKLLKSTRVPFVDSKEQKGWKGSPTSINYLTQAGEMYYNLLPYESYKGRSGEANILVNLNHHYGIHQVLACIAGACSVSSLNLLTYLKSNPQGDETGVEKILRLEWDSCVELKSVKIKSGPVRVEQSESFCRPDALGTIVLEGHFTEAFLVRAGLKLPKTKTMAPPSKYPFISDPNGSSSLHWNYILEYDESTEDLNFFAGKASKYIKLCNTDIPGLWPEEWRGQFPATILVVTSGGALRALNMLLAVAKKLEEARITLPGDNKNKKIPDNWWFTTTDWFKQAYSPFIGSYNKKPKDKPNYSNGKIWLPLPEVMQAMDNKTPAEKKAAILSLDNSLKKEGKAAGALADKLVGLPIYFPEIKNTVVNVAATAGEKTGS